MSSRSLKTDHVTYSRIAFTNCSKRCKFKNINFKIYDLTLRYTLLLADKTSCNISVKIIRQNLKICQNTLWPPFTLTGWVDLGRLFSLGTCGALSVRPSVCLSVCTFLRAVRIDRTRGLSVEISRVWSGTGTVVPVG